MEIETGEKPLCRLHKGIDKVVVCLAPHAFVAIAEVEWILQEARAVRSAVEHDRQHRCGVNPRRRGIDHQLSDGDIGSVRPPVADAENALSIRRNDETDLTAARRLLQRRLDLLRMIDREIRRLLRVDKLLAVLLDALSDHGIVDDRHELCDMLTKHIVEQTAVAVEHIHQEAALLDPRALALHLLIDALRLLRNRVNMRRQEARKSKLHTFVGTERRPLVLKWIAQQSIPFLVHNFLLFVRKHSCIRYSRKALRFPAVHNL